MESGSSPILNINFNNKNITVPGKYQEGPDSSFWIIKNVQLYSDSEI